MTDDPQAMRWFMVQLLTRPFSEAEFIPIEAAINGLPIYRVAVLNIYNAGRRGGGLVQAQIQAPAGDMAVQAVELAFKRALRRGGAPTLELAAYAEIESPELKVRTSP